MKTDTTENVKFIVTNFKDIFTSYVTTTYPKMFSFGLSSVISKVFVADFEQVFFCWKKNYCCSNPKIPCPANKYLLKVSSRNPKARGEICEKLTVETALLY